MDPSGHRRLTREEIIEAIEQLLPEQRHAQKQEHRTEGVFDRDAFTERMLGDKELAQEVVDLFLDYEPQLMANIRQALTKKDGKALATEVYALKGSVANLAVRGVLDTVL